MRDAFSIAHILPFNGVGGTELATLRLMQAATEHGYSCIAVHRPEASAVRELFADAGFHTVAWDAPEPSLRRPWPWWKAAGELAQELTKRRICLIHAADWLGAYQCSLAAVRAKLPLLCHIRNRYDTISRRDALFLRPVHRFAFVSHQTRATFPLRLPDSRTTVLYDGIDPAPAPDPGDRAAVFAEFGLPADTFLFGMAARVSPQKDYPTLIAAAAKVTARHPHARFFIIGDCSRSEAHREHYAGLIPLLTTHGLHKSVIFADFRTDVPRLLNALDSFVLSTHWEGFPLVILEAMAHALPVVATAVDGIPEIVREGETGLLYPHADSSALAAQLNRLIEDSPLAARLAASGQALVASEFSRARFGANVDELYRSFRS